MSAAWLADAVRVAPHIDRFTHGFHTYPARLHPDTAERLLRDLAPGRAVLDPFVGSGTVLVEGLVAGLEVFGADLSPLAVRIARLKTWRTDAATRSHLVERARAVAERSFARVRGRVPVRAPLTPEDAAWYAPHVLMELGGLLAEIRSEPPGPTTDAIELAFSSILLKVSRQRADTRRDPVERRIRKGLSTELFGAKVIELAERLERLAAAVPRGTPVSTVLQADARDIAGARALASRRGRIARVVTSPPYGGTYDYAHAQALRSAWLGLDDRAYRRGEIGARRHAADEEEPAAHGQALARVLAGCASLLRDGGEVVLVLGDARFGPRRIVGALDWVRRIAPEAGLRWVASASQQRPSVGTEPSDFDRLDPPREEHVILLVRDIVSRS
ncbi:MAG: hypothetical protein IT379_32225 [Deltaproteobacteria bacterium]|nr:hypothetical protein [Deltaproteobacteria bacterium]